MNRSFNPSLYRPVEDTGEGDRKLPGRSKGIRHE